MNISARLAASSAPLREIMKSHNAVATLTCMMLSADVAMLRAVYDGRADVTMLPTWRLSVPSWLSRVPMSSPCSPPICTARASRPLSASRENASRDMRRMTSARPDVCMRSA